MSIAAQKAAYEESLARAEMLAGLRAQRQKVIVSPLPLVGETGVVLTNLNPHGVVQVQHETWSATAVAEPINVGEQVELVGHDGLYLQVRRVQGKRETGR